MKQNIEIYFADATPCTGVVLVHSISITEFFKFWRNLVIPIRMAEFCVKSGRIPPKLEWLAAMYVQYENPNNCRGAYSTRSPHVSAKPDFVMTDI